MKRLFSHSYNQTGTWLDNLPAIKCLQQLYCTISHAFLFFSKLRDYFIYLSHKHKRSYQRGIITTIKCSRGADFPMLEFTIWVSSELTCLRAPFLSPPKNTLTHTIRSYFTHSVVSLNLDKPQGYKKHSTVFVSPPSLACFLSLPHSPHATQYLPCTGRTMPSCFCCSASAPGQNIFWTAPGFPAPPECTSPARSH